MSGAGRPAVCVLTAHWGDETRDRDAVVRLLAGCLAGVADVEVVALDPGAAEPTRARDSVFSVTRVPLRGVSAGARAVLSSALRAAGGDGEVPSRASSLLGGLDGHAPGLEAQLRACSPDVLVLAGLPVPLSAGAISALGVERVVFCPLLGDPEAARRPEVGALVALADVVGSADPGEHAALLEAAAPAGTPVVPLDVALTLNRAATAQGLFGVAWFGRYVLSIRRFPTGGARHPTAVTRELLRSVLGPIAIAEVDGTKWRVTDFENTAELPVNPTRVNLWRLMAHAEFTIDLRPPTPFGREALESMLYGAPALVPERSAAHAHAEAAGGGLWYAEPGEVLDGAVRLFDDLALRRELAESGNAYALARHGDMDDFVRRTRALVLGLDR